MRAWWWRRSETFQGASFMAAYLGAFAVAIAVGSVVVGALR